MKTKLNLGCGARALPGWLNLDFQASPPLVIGHDLRRPLPCADATFEAVYHSHVLEHLERDDALNLLRECHRVLKPGGVLRVVVPDLENKARLYLEKLALAKNTQATDDLAHAEHEWTVIEMLDQLVRTRPGGAMHPFLVSGRADKLAEERIGDEFARAQAWRPSEHAPTGWREQVRKTLRRLLGIAEAEWRWLRFRHTGENHLWMYDEVSLRSVLRAAGFVSARVRTAFESDIAGWATEGQWLDVENQVARKPDSLYMEATKPPAA